MEDIWFTQQQAQAYMYNVGIELCCEPSSCEFLVFTQCANK